MKKSTPCSLLFLVGSFTFLACAGGGEDGADAGDGDGGDGDGDGGDGDGDAGDGDGDAGDGDGDAGDGDGDGGDGDTGYGDRSIDVCAFEGEGEITGPDADGFLVVAPAHPHLWYMGRVDCEAAGGPRFGFPGVSIRVKFSGTELRATFLDGGQGTATTTNYLDVSVDAGAPTALQMTAGAQEYVLAQGLAEGEHEVLLWKRTEASPGGSVNAGTLQLQRLRFLGQELLAAQGPERRLEFVGDSITCGYGSEVSTDDPDSAPFTTANENSRLAYGAVTAGLLSADYLSVAYSGKGMSRNYNGGAGETVPEFYLDILPDDATAPAWDPTSSVPDALIINVGTNDFSTVGFDTALYTERYAEFLATLRDYYPDTLFVAAIGPMLSDYYPVGAMAWTEAQKGVQDAVALRESAGDSNIRFLAFAPQTAPYGEDWHPTAATHAAMAEQLATLLREELGW